MIKTVQLKDYFALPEEHTLSINDAQALNARLSESTAHDVPEEKRDQILDYLSAALLMDSVDTFHKPGVEKLILEIKNSSLL
jgi:hypothetical protein